MNRSRLELAKPQIYHFFEELAVRVHRFADIRRYLAENRAAWRLARYTTATHLINSILGPGKLSKFEFPFPAPYKRETRYAWGNTSVLQVMLSLDRTAYFSHHTALALHGLVDEPGDTTYLSIELLQIPSGPHSLTQQAINNAFKRAQRVTKRIAETKHGRLSVLSAKNNKGLGIIEEQRSPEEGTLRFTSLERTLIDCTVRPAYAGGVSKVQRAYQLAKGKVSVNRLSDVLQQLDYVYPYHQAIGFHLECAGYDAASVNLFRKFPLTFDFYLAHGITDTLYVKDWRLHIPKNVFSRTA